MWNIDIILMQQYYETLTTPRGGQAQRGRETKNLSRVDTLSIQK
jgi:hypothetical protein